jgi:hypothetical protein
MAMMLRSHAQQLFECVCVYVICRLVLWMMCDACVMCHVRVCVGEVLLCVTCVVDDELCVNF